MFYAESIRTSKTVSGVRHEYYLDGAQIEAETFGNTLLIYLYDAEGAPIGMQYRTASMPEGQFHTFWFEKNMQGDMIAVYTENGTKIGSYKYDAWGVCTASTESGTTTLQKQIVRTYNPFRYRGYYYDTDTSLYYLQSRYYNPQWGRFLNADGYVNANGDLIGFNMFAYCSNNPVMLFDPTGCWFYTCLNDDYGYYIMNRTHTIGGYSNNTQSMQPEKPDSLYKYLQDKHFSRNENNIMPDEGELLDIVNGNSDEWIPVKDSLNIYHRFTNGTQGEEAQYNKKYMSKDGRYEVIICYAPDKGIGPYIVTDPNNEGTYNYGPGTGINHFLKDILPYWLWKNSEEDTTNWHERMFGN